MCGGADLAASIATLVFLEIIIIRCDHVMYGEIAHTCSRPEMITNYSHNKGNQDDPSGFGEKKCNCKMHQESRVYYTARAINPTYCLPFSPFIGHDNLCKRLPHTVAGCAATLVHW